MKYENNKIVYEVGDWVVVTEVGCTHYGKGAFQTKESNYDGFSLKHKIEAYKSGWLRPATQKEIDKATKEEKIMVGEYEVKFHVTDTSEDWDNIRVGCQVVTKDLFLKIGKKAGWL